MKSIIKLAAALFAASAVLSTSAAAQTVSISTLPPGSINNVQTQAIAKVEAEPKLEGRQMMMVLAPK